MAYIKSLICEGFKSFKERTKINFSNGFTSIVGANGSGKSNILDAFVFSLGELSGNKMRVNKVKDLICLRLYICDHVADKVHDVK